MLCMAAGSIFVVNRERVIRNSSMTDQGIEERSKDDRGKLLRDQVNSILCILSVSMRGSAPPPPISR